MAVSVLCLFLMVPWVGMWSLIVAFPGHTHMFFDYCHGKVMSFYISPYKHTVCKINLYFLVFVPSSENTVDPDQLVSDNEDT